MKLRFFQIVSSLLLVVLLFSCKKDNVDILEPDSKNIENLSISDNFDFKTEREVQIKFSLSYEDSYSIVEIYKNDPNRGGSIIIAGKLKNKTFNQTVILPQYIDHLYFRLKQNNGMSKYFDVPINNNLAEYNYTPMANNRAVSITNTYDCSSNCTQTISESGTYNNVNVNEGETLCILEGVTVSGSINVNGGTLSVCGTVNANVNLNGTSPTIIIGETGNISIYNFNSNVRIINYKDNLSLPTTINGYLENYALINVSGYFTLNSGAVLVNNGDINVSGTLINNGEIINNSNLDVIVFTQNSSGKLTNNCHFSVDANLVLMSNFFTNNGYINVGANLQVYSGSKIELSGNSYIECGSLLLNGIINNSASDYARIDVSSSTYLYNTAVILGLVDICDNDGVELSEANIDAQVQYCQTSIPQTDCNPGIGTVNAVDGDNDGIVDAVDVFPTDPERSFVSYFPEKNFGTFAFEDLWPYKGDYDFNDLVVKYQYRIISNSVGLVKEIEYTFKLAAAGGSFKNGFGLEFPVEASFVENNSMPVNLYEDIISLTEKNIESNQSKAVIIAFDNSIKTLLYPGGGVTGINTNNGAPYSEPKTIVGTIVFSTPQDIMKDLPFNPFMFINLDRGKEVHLLGNEPTDLVNRSYFNTGVDISNNGVYYKTENNLPWALHILSEFDYPIEKVEITDAHLKFFDWASSGGEDFSDWYLNKVGYRNSDNIFTP